VSDEHANEHAIRDLLPGYALGCLDPEDERAVSAHLPGCSACREELGSFVQVTDRLSTSVPAAKPPARLEPRILGGIGSLAPRVSRFPRRVAWRPALASMAAVFVAALVAGNLLQWTGVIRPAGRAGDTRLMTVMLAGTSDARGAYGTIVLDTADREGVLAVTGLPRLDDAHQYQLWLIRGAERRSGGVFSVDAEGYGSLLLKVPTDFRDFRAFGISIEPAGGSTAPTGAKVMAGAL
jgi:anti-sigma-K factor RskA